MDLTLCRLYIAVTAFAIETNAYFQHITGFACRLARERSHAFQFTSMRLELPRPHARWLS